MTNRIYCGYAKEVPTKHGGFMKVSLREVDIKTLKENINQIGWVNIDIKRIPIHKVGTNRLTHYLEVNKQEVKNYCEGYYDAPDDYNDGDYDDDAFAERVQLYDEEVLNHVDDSDYDEEDEVEEFDLDNY